MLRVAQTTTRGFDVLTEAATSVDALATASEKSQMP
jgi:hypothetical protein